MFHIFRRAAAARLLLRAVALVALAAPCGGASAGQIIQSFNLGPITEAGTLPLAGNATFPLVHFSNRALFFKGFDPTLGTLLSTEIAVTAIFGSGATSAYTQLPSCFNGTCGGGVTADLLHELRFETPTGTLSTFTPPILSLDRGRGCTLPSGKLLGTTCLTNFGYKEIETTGLQESMGTYFATGSNTKFTILWGIELNQKVRGVYDFGSTSYSALFAGQLDVTYNYASTTSPPPPSGIPAPASGSLFMLGLACLAFVRRRRLHPTTRL